MKRILFIILTFISLNTYSQTLLYNGSATTITTTRGGIKIDSLFLIPVRGVGNYYPTAVHMIGRIQINSADSSFIYHNGNSWIKPLIPKDTIGKFKHAGWQPNWLQVNDRPTTLSQFTNDLGNYGSWITKSQGDNYYRPISYTPTWSEVTSKPSFATVATSGSYNDLSARPNTITLYNSSGVVNQNLKVWSSLVTGSTSNGQSTSITSAGFTTIVSVQITPVENVSNQNGALISVRSTNTSSVVTNIYKSKTTGVLIGGSVDGLEFHNNPSNVSFYLTVIGY